MTVNVSWYDEEQTIILQEFPMNWTWEDFFEAVGRTVELEKTVSHPVYILGTNPKNGQMPKGNSLAQFNAALKMHPPHMRYYILATNNTFVALMGRVLLQTSGLREKTRLVNTVDDGLRLIADDKVKSGQQVN